jgi:hypothetical protein
MIYKPVHEPMFVLGNSSGGGNSTIVTARYSSASSRPLLRSPRAGALTPPAVRRAQMRTDQRLLCFFRAREPRRGGGSDAAL